MVGYAWMNALHSIRVVATLTHPTIPRSDHAPTNFGTTVPFT
jgi:hypothetical protein